MLSTLLLTATALLQVAAPQDFSGTWVAQLKGQTYARLQLTVSDGKIHGQLSLAGIHVDANGEVDSVTDGFGDPKPIFDVGVRDGILSFARKDEDDTDRFELRLVDGRASLVLLADAELRAELAQEGIPLPRPLTMTRTAP
jgi:hypothetical protein